MYNVFKTYFFLHEKWNATIHHLWEQRIQNQFLALVSILFFRTLYENNRDFVLSSIFEGHEEKIHNPRTINYIYLQLFCRSRAEIYKERLEIIGDDY